MTPTQCQNNLVKISSYKCEIKKIKITQYRFLLTHNMQMNLNTKTTRQDRMLKYCKLKMSFKHLTKPGYYKK